MDHMYRRTVGAGLPIAGDEESDNPSSQARFALRKENWLSILDGIGLCALAVEKNGIISRANKTVSRLLARDTNSVIGESITHILPELSQASSLSDRLTQVAGSGKSQDMLARHGGGRDIPVTATISHSIHDDDHRFLVVLHDQDQKENTLDQLLRTDRFLTDIMDSFQLCAFEWDMENDDVRFQGSWQQAFNLKAPSGSSSIQWLLDQLHGEDHGLVLKELRDLRKNATYRMECEARIQPGVGPERWVLIRAGNRVDEQGKAQRIVGAVLDITSYKSAEEQSEQIVKDDALTGLPNRQYLLSHIQTNCRRGDFALVVIDIDRFRHVNQSLGTWVGDDVIRILAERIRHRIRKDDVVCRLSGDQFAILIHDAKDDAHIHEQIARIRRRIGETVNLGAGVTVNLDINAGIRCWKDITNEDPEDLLRDAIIALRSAKEYPSGKIMEYSDELQQKMMNAALFEKDVRSAFRNRGIEAFYQPVIETRSGHPTGFEALARLRHPERGIIAPADFIPLAEETGLINDLAREIIRQSTQQLAAWRKQYPSLPPLTMAINLSPAQFDDDWIIDEVKRALQETGLQGADLKIEITETLLMDNIAGTTRILDQLRALGIQVCIDDFGTGYSSLSYLRNYSFDTLKIDRSFISQITEDPRHAELVRTIVQLGQNVGMNIVVEGVESHDQHSLLTELGCHFLQGFLVAEPLDARDATDWLRRWVT